MEPTIYKPSIYKGAGIYKAGAEGGGGGGIPQEVPAEYLQGLAVDNPNGYGDTNGLIEISVNSVTSADYVEVNLYPIHHNNAGVGVRFREKNTVNGAFSFFNKYNYDPGVMLSTVDGTAMSPRLFVNNQSQSDSVIFKLNAPTASVNNGSNIKKDGTVLTTKDIDKIQVFHSPDQYRGAVGKIEVWDSDHITNKIMLIPAKEKESGHVGFYDKVSGNFYYSTRTDTLVLVEF